MTVQYASKRMQRLVKFVCRNPIRQRATLYGLPLDLCRKRRIRNCGSFCQTHRNSANVPHFHDKKRRNLGLRRFTRRRTAARPSKCGAAIKVQRTRWEKSGAHGATFSSAVAARLLHSF